MKLQLKLAAALLAMMALTICMSGCSLFRRTRTCAMVLEKSMNTQDETKITTEYVFGKIEAALSQRKDLKIIDRSKVDAVKTEHAAEGTDWSNPETVAQIGKQLDAELLCFVYVYRGTYKVEFLNINTFEKVSFDGEYSTKLLSRKVKVKSLWRLKRLSLNSL